jgi:hypothetical protein
MMQQIGCEPERKDEGLSAFRQRGWLLVDSTYDPVDDLSDKDRDEVILRDYPLLCADLATLLPYTHANSPYKGERLPTTETAAHGRWLQGA